MPPISPICIRRLSPSPVASSMPQSGIYSCRENNLRYSTARPEGAHMIRARWIGVAATAVALGSVFLFRACDPIITGKPTDFSYTGHERPRVFVSHHPLVPRPGTELTVRLEPDLPANAAVRQAKAVLRDPATNASETRTC